MESQVLSFIASSKHIVPDVEVRCNSCLSRHDRKKSELTFRIPKIVAETKIVDNFLAQRKCHYCGM